MDTLLAFIHTDLAHVQRALASLTAAAILGGVVGYQRERMRKDAGLRTHMLVSLGTAIVVICAHEIGMENDGISRVLQGLVTGIGFIGTGAILKRVEQNAIRGLTTAASLWATAAIGIACGLGLVAIAAISTALVWFIVAVLPILEKRLAPADGEG